MNKAKVEKIIKEIIDKCKDGDYIFHGECKDYDNRNEKGEKVISQVFIEDI